MSEYLYKAITELQHDKEQLERQVFQIQDENRKLKAQLEAQKNLPYMNPVALKEI